MSTQATAIYEDGVLTEAEGLPLINSVSNARAALDCDPRPALIGGKGRMPGRR